MRSELSALWRLAWPVVLGQIGMVAMGTVDLMMVGRLGERELAAVGMGNLWSFGVLIIALGTLRGIDPLFSQAHGAGDRAGVGAALGRAVLVALLLSVPVDLLHRLAGPGLRLLQQPEEAIGLAAAYVDAVRWGIVPYLLFNVQKLFLQNLGRTLLPTLVILAANVLNVALNALFIYGFGWGVVGCGWSTAGCRLLSLLMLVALAWPLLRQYPRPPLRALAAPRAVGRVLGVGLPVGFQYGVEVWAFNAAGVMAGWLGTTAFAAHQILLNITALTFMVPLGLGIAASARVGQKLGAGERWQPAGWVAVGATACWMLLCAAGLWLLAPSALRLYTTETAVISVALTLVPIAVAFQLFDGVQAVTAGVLRGAGDTRSPALVNLLGFWGLGLPVAYVWGVTTGDARGIWLGLMAGLGAVALLLVAQLWRVSRAGGYRRV